MPRASVKLLLLDEHDRVLLVHAADPRTGLRSWYPVGGGVDLGESLDQAARREAYEETGLAVLPPGDHVWTREHTYRFDGRTVEVHEDWLLHRVAHYVPAPAQLSDYEVRTVLGFRWWSTDVLRSATETVFPPTLGDLLAALLRDGIPAAPVDISDPTAP
ncbi:NUDIX hydrolase [Nocardioides ganghwensis]|uniref:NUDIX domain-containing protein n=1 Tax=Nocardioides ganghwensis TaxID=252230 RepID=A0A4Q2S883_9ACTN|nr:NUDIX domain-containing protein [Nocardioides ganghwensis]MBD3945863.1 NUDIX domain-containing protein [Nocardioides ganghwensis]RYB98778.1 NUDIX domain-containing protein [Nocardioides ganghwensis]